MPINKTPFMSLSFMNDIVAEFPDSAPHSLSEFYGADIQNVPTSGTIKFSDFYGAATKTLVTYSIIGGGGAGGYSRENGDFGKGSFAKAGGNTSISSTTLGTITSIGGIGGENAALVNSAGTAGASSTQGIGGLGGNRNKDGGSATGYGSGGGGAGGDLPSPFANLGIDPEGGNGGKGGGASTTVTGSQYIRYGETITITVGLGGIGSGGDHKGGNGSQGYCVLTYNGKSTSFTANATFTIV